VTQVSPVYTDLVPDPWLAAAYRVAIIGLGRSPLSPQDERGRPTGSTDMGNVTQVLPAIHPTISIDCGDAVNHQPEFAAACATPSADRAVCDGALALALTGLAAATDEAQRDRLIDAQRERRIGPERERRIGSVSRRHGAPAIADGGEL
jgi:metal-dependent amidase/aminoacylase/carboxypeptidase family protein